MKQKKRLFCSSKFQLFISQVSYGWWTCQNSTICFTDSYSGNFQPCSVLEYGSLWNTINAYCLARSYLQRHKMHQDRKKTRSKTAEHKLQRILTILPQYLLLSAELLIIHSNLLIQRDVLYTVHDFGQGLSSNV